MTILRDFDRVTSLSLIIRFVIKANFPNREANLKTHLEEHFAVEMMMVVRGKRGQLSRSVMRVVVRIFFLVFVHHHCNREKFVCIKKIHSRMFAERETRVKGLGGISQTTGFAFNGTIWFSYALQL